MEFIWFKIDSPIFLRTILFASLFSVLTLSCERRPERREIIPITATQAYSGIIQNLDPVYPGRGLDYFDEIRKDRPMAYGLLLSSEARHFKFAPDSSVLERMRRCGGWLIRNSDLNGDGITGYGLADSADAFSDSTRNPAHQEYAITTAIALKGLMDWYEVEPDSAKKADILSVSTDCLLPYLGKNLRSPDGLPVYSMNRNDSEYNVYNSSSFLAGRMQHLSTLTHDDSLRELLTERSAEIIEIMLNYAQTDDEGNLQWDYGNNDRLDRPNDLLHVCYVIEGVRDYLRYQGEANVNWKRLVNPLFKFKENGRWYEFLEPELQNEDYEPRLWTLGILMYSLAMEGEYNEIEETLWPQIEEYHLGDGQFGFKPDDDRQMIRQTAHLMVGLSYFLYQSDSTFISPL